MKINAPKTDTLVCSVNNTIAESTEIQQSSLAYFKTYKSVCDKKICWNLETFRYSRDNQQFQAAQCSQEATEDDVIL